MLTCVKYRLVIDRVAVLAYGLGWDRSNLTALTVRMLWRLERGKNVFFFGAEPERSLGNGFSRRQVRYQGKTSVPYFYLE